MKKNRTITYESNAPGLAMREEYESKVLELQKQFLNSYAASKDTMTVDEWLPYELHRQLPDYSEADISAISIEILESVKLAENMKAAQQKAVASGRSKESWLASKLVETTSQMSVQESAKYLQELDDAVRNANEAMYDTITTKAGLANQNKNLDGFIAEQHHVNSYNMKAKATGGELHAEVLKPKPGETYQKNSVDVVIKDSSGKIVNRYQVKYGKTAEDTIQMIKGGNYRGQQLIVPADQVEAVQKAFPDRKVSSTIGDGKTKSTPYTKAQAKEDQRKVQQGNILEANWNGFAAKDIALGISKQVGIAGLQGAAIGAGMELVSKAWKGEPIDGEKVVETALVAGSDASVKVAVAGALKAASEKGVLKVIPKGTPASTLANIAFIAVENVKVLRRVANGELTVKEGFDQMQQTTGSCVAGIVAAAKGASVGATIGAVLGPIGSAVGGFVGGAVGYMAGSKMGQAVIKGAQKVRDKEIETVELVRVAAIEGVKNTGRFLQAVLG